MNSNVEFTILMYMARDHMENNGFSPTSVSYYMRTWRSVYNFALSKGINQYSAELAEQYMLEKYNLRIGENSIENTALSPYMTQKIRALRALTDFKLTGFVNKESRGEAVIWPVNYKESCERYMNHFRSLGYKDSTIRKHELILCRFSKFLDTKNIKPEEICAEHIYEYYKTLAHYSKGHLVNVRITLIHALKDFYKNGYCPNDLSSYVPMVRYYSKSKVDKVWSQEEISKMLKCIDRSNPIGKRNYAIMLIASNLGLRTSDPQYWNPQDTQKDVIWIENQSNMLLQQLKCTTTAGCIAGIQVKVSSNGMGYVYQPLIKHVYYYPLVYFGVNGDFPQIAQTLIQNGYLHQDMVGVDFVDARAIDPTAFDIICNYQHLLLYIFQGKMKPSDLITEALNDPTLATAISATVLSEIGISCEY